MDTSKSTDEARTASFVAHSRGQPSLKLEAQNTAGVSNPAVDTSEITPPHGKVPHHPELPDTTSEPCNNANILSPALITSTMEQTGRKVVLKDIFLECSDPDYFGDEISLVYMCGGNVNPIRLTNISPTKWKVINNIELNHSDADINLIVEAEDGVDEAILTFTADEIYAMACKNEDTPVERMFESVNEDNPQEVKMSFSAVSSETRGPDLMSTPMWLASLLAAYSGVEVPRPSFGGMGNADDINQSMSWHFERAISFVPPPSHADRPSQLNTLGNSHLRRFERTGDLRDIDCAISHHERAVQSTPNGHADLPRWLNDLGVSFARRFTRTGDLQDINCAISHHKSAMELTPSGHADLPALLSNLGTSYVSRFIHVGDLQDVDCAIAHHQRSIDSTPPGHTDLPSRFSNIGTSYLCRFERTGDLQDIDCAISHHKRAIESTRSWHAGRATLLSNIGNSYTRRFERTGDLQDIDYAISHHQRAIDSTPHGHADLPGWFKNLGNSYLCRFERTTDLHDIDCAISYHRAAIQSTPAGHTDLPSHFNSLGNSYFYRFERTGDLEDIDCAISHHTKSVQSTPSGHVQLLGRFNNLANSYSCRFQRTRDIQDIESAISYHQKAVQSTPAGHADLPSRLNNLGISYSCRFDHTRELEDIECAIFHQKKAIICAPPGHADLPGWLKNLGNSYSTRFNSNHCLPDVQSSIAAYRQSASSIGSPSIRLGSAKQAAFLSSVHDRSQCLVDFAIAIGLLSEVAGLEQTIKRRYANLQGHADFVTSAVATALDLDRLDLAIEWLEQGRCLVWNQLNQLRTPIDDLRSKNSSLADRFIEVASALESYGSRSTLPSSSSAVTLAEDIRLQNDTQNHTVYAAQYSEILDEIRALSDFHDFLRPPKAIDILSALPSNCPVVVFNIHKTRCDALALISGIKEPLHIPLENFNLEQAEKLQKTLRFDILKQRDMEDHDRLPQRVRLNPLSMTSVLEELWRKAVQPILEALGYSLTPSERRRIWWCPTGPLAFLPLHAAGIYGPHSTPGSCVTDYAVSSYTPTIQSLREKYIASSTVPKHTNLLLISPNTPDLPAIPFTQTEIHDLKVLMDRFNVNALLLEDGAATIETAKRELNTHNWVHFACHGIQDIQDPLKSGVHLYDGRLELLEIMRQRSSNPELAFLSACQTSKGDLKLSEEVVHLAAGMLTVGYRGVVGTMWSISDRHGPEFAKWFYEYLLEHKGSEGLDSTRAAYALDCATRKVRESLRKDDAAFLTWVPYVHFGY